MGIRVGLSVGVGTSVGVGDEFIVELTFREAILLSIKLAPTNKKTTIIINIKVKYFVLNKSGLFLMNFLNHFFIFYKPFS